MRKKDVSKYLSLIFQFYLNWVKFPKGLQKVKKLSFPNLLRLGSLLSHVLEEMQIAEIYFEVKFQSYLKFSFKRNEYIVTILIPFEISFSIYPF